MRYTVRNQSDSHEIDGKIDYNMSQKHTVFGRFMIVPESRAIPYDFDPTNVLTVGTGGASNHGLLLHSRRHLPDQPGDH